MEIETLKDLYLEQLRDLYDAEERLKKAYPVLAGAASDETLQQTFRGYAEASENQQQRIRKIFERLDTSPDGETCYAMAGLLKETESVLQQTAEPAVQDAALIASVQRIEHYEIAGFGTARTYAAQLGFEDDVDFLEASLREAASADMMLSQMAVSTINPDAVAG